MNTPFGSYDLTQLLQTEAAQWKATLEENCQTKKMELPAAAGKGILKTYDFEDGFQMLVFDGHWNDDIRWTFKSSKASPFMLFFSTNGKAALHFDGDKEDTELHSLQTVLAALPSGEPQTIVMKAGEETMFAALFIERGLYIHHTHCFSETVSAEFAAIFSGAGSIKNFRNSEYGLDTAALVQEIMTDGQEGLPHATFVKAKAMEIFSIQLRRWELELNEKHRESTLPPQDVQKVMQARNLLIQNLQHAPTIVELARLAAINQQKLKFIFKRVFNKTINEYLREERLTTARHLLAAGQISIREVASSIGYENASYFARRFKEKFGVYPSSFLDAMRKEDVVEIIPENTTG